MEKIKNFIHNHENIEKIILYFWGLFSVFKIKMIFRKISTKASEKRKFKVLIYGLRTIPTTSLVYADVLLGKAFEKLGCQVKVIYCDGFLDSCDAVTVSRGHQKPQCFMCNNLGGCFKKAIGLDCISFGDFISREEAGELKRLAEKIPAQDLLSYKYMGVEVGRHAKSSEIRYFTFGKIDINNPEEQAVFREKLANGMIITKIASRVFEKESPDMVVMMHGIYSSWGPFLNYFNLKNVETIVHENLSQRYGYFNFFRNHDPFRAFAHESWMEFRKKPLEESEKKWIEDYLSDRFQGKTGEYLFFNENIKEKDNKEKIRENIFRKQYERRFAMYPNVAWDESVSDNISDVFSDVFEWVDSTVNFFKNNPKYQLIIKPHPAELLFDKSKIGVVEYIQKKHGSLPENIVFLTADTPLRAHEIIDKNTVCLTYNGTVGLELATQGVPVIAVSNIYYVKAGAVKRINSKDEFFSFLSDPSEIFEFAKNNIETAKKCAYFHFYKSMIRMPFLRLDKWSVIDWKALNDKDILSENSKLVRICEKMINKEHVLEPL